MPKALLSVSDKRGLVELGQGLSELNWELIASGGTARALRQAGLAVMDVADVTGAPEMLGGRVKTLHPAVHTGILARDSAGDRYALAAQGYDFIDLVVCNLYPFAQTVAQPDVTLVDAVENIDIGGVTLLRAAAKNFERVTVMCDPGDYEPVLAELQNAGGVSAGTRQRLALKAFRHTRDYDTAIAAYLAGQSQAPEARREQPLRYGCNPHQKPARVFVNRGALPFEVLNGSPGYINLLDALNGWPLVRELKQALNLPAAASFKHVSPAGAAVALPLGDDLRRAYFVTDLELSPLATAYARARGADRMSSFGDWVALSEVVDVQTARLLQREVSDGVIAPGYAPEALEILRRKKGGNYPIIRIDPDYEPAAIERRDVFGITFEQPRNAQTLDQNLLENIVTARRDLPAGAVRDLLVATIAVKYTQSNSVCLAHDGQVIGLGAGQQSRIHCTRLAADKADAWWLRQHPKVLAFQFKADASRPARINAIDQYLLSDFDPATQPEWGALFAAVPPPLTPAERQEWLAGLSGVALSSDAFFPFRDSLDRAARSGVRYVIQTGGSVRDEEVIAAADEHEMTMVLSGVRLFHH
ncbi:MAG: phosphoribosylaminoimidazolecarboxamide formyltransferase [Anaerolineae bacterium]